MDNTMNRRHFIGKNAAAVVSATVVSASGPDLAAQEQGAKPIRIGVIGPGGRGTGMMQWLITQNAGVDVTAICDINQAHVDNAVNIVKKIKGNTPVGYCKGPYGYRQMLERDDIDAVLITTPVPWHARMAIDSMKAGKHVGTEVTAGHDLNELWELVKTKEETGKRYMMLENYIYWQKHMMVYNMVRQGVFGDLQFGECSYVHDCRFLMFKRDGSLTWRGELYRDVPGNWYPTHALGPVCKWFGINDGDRLEYCTSMATSSTMDNKYAAQKFGADSPQAKMKYKAPDFVSTTIRTAKGRVIRTDFTTQCNRPVSHYYMLQGSNATFDEQYDSHCKIAIGGHSWGNLAECQEKYNHNFWKKDGAAADRAGHLGGDYFVLREFVNMVRHDREPWIDVYDAASWSVITHCSNLSISQGSKPVEIPDFTEGRWQNPNWRKANWPA